MSRLHLTYNFTIEEFDCSDGTQVPEELVPNIQKLANNLQLLRDHIGKPIHINSGYRSPEYNEAVGGVMSSRHVKGQAADIRVVGMTPDEVANKIEDLIQQGIMDEGGLGRYMTFTHYDVRGFRSRWDYR